jgi:hypothetical protein
MAKQLTLHEAALKRVVVNNAAIAWFQPFVANWANLPVSVGSCPSPEMFTIAAAFAKRGAGRESAFTAMNLRPEGCSVQQHGTAFDSGPAKNHYRDLWRAGYFTATKVPVAGTMGNAYKLELTEQGVAHLESLGVIKASKAKPAKATGKPAGKRKPKPVPVPAEAETPISDAPAGNGSVPEPVTDTALAALASHFNA